MLTPLMIEQQILETSNNIFKGIKIRLDAQQKMDEAKEELEIARSQAYLDAEGTAAEREAEVNISTAEQKHDYDVAARAYRYAELKGKALDQQQSALQSVLSSMRTTYQTAGIGER